MLLLLLEERERGRKKKKKNKKKLWGFFQKGDIRQGEMVKEEVGVIQVQKVSILLFHPEMYTLRFA